MGSSEPIFIHIYLARHQTCIYAGKKFSYETKKNTFNPIDANPFCSTFSLLVLKTKLLPKNIKRIWRYILTDDPANYDEVIIDVRDVKINYSTDTANGWKSLSQVNAKPYDILRLVNDKDTILGQTDLDSGRIEQIRLILGPNNYVKVNGQTYTLETPSAQQSGLKINLHQDVSAGLLYKLLLDFDAARSIVKQETANTC